VACLGVSETGAGSDVASKYFAGDNVTNKKDLFFRLPMGCFKQDVNTYQMQI